jgi:hypothetical protein
LGDGVNGARDNRGAAPVAELARLDSDMHHVREQADMDRRSTAARLIEERQHRERMELAIATTASQLARVGDLTNRLDVANTANTAYLSDLRLELATMRATTKVVAGLVVLAVPLIGEVLRHVFR